MNDRTLLTTAPFPMGIRRLILFRLLVTSVLVGRTHGFGTGAPTAQCSAMTPGHGQKTQTGKSPFTITPSSTTYTPNVPIQGKCAIQARLSLTKNHVLQRSVIPYDSVSGSF